MADALKWKAGSRITAKTVLYEGYEVKESWIAANVSVDKIDALTRGFIAMLDEPLFFILELPSNAREEQPVRPGVVDKLHKDVYYIDGCSREKALAILDLAGPLLCQDGLAEFGFAGHASGYEIMFGKYNAVFAFGKPLDAFAPLFAAHGIPRVDHLITAWDTFTADTPGNSSLYEWNGKTVYDLPEMLKEQGIYFAERREEQ